MKAAAFIIFILITTTIGATAFDGEWNIYLDSSAINSTTLIGNQLWCGTNGGILLLDLSDTTFTSYYDGLELRSNEITSVTIDARGSIWAAMEAYGIVRIDNPDGNFSVKQYSATLDMLLSDSVTCLLRVEDDIYYGCTEGLAKFYNNIHTYEPQITDSLAGTRIHDIAWNPSSNILWVACENGVASYHRSTYAYDFYSIGEAISICVHDGEAYCVTPSGVRSYSAGAWDIFGSGLHMAPVAVSSGGGELFCITPERTYLWNGNFWQAQDNLGLKGIFRDRYIISYSKNILNAITVDEGGTPWIGGVYTDGLRGAYLSSFSNGSWTNFAPEGLSQNEIVRLDVEDSGYIWASTSGFGISGRSPSGQWTAYTEIRSDVGDEALSFHINNLALVVDSKKIMWCNSLDYDLDHLVMGDPADKDDDVWIHYSLGEGTITSNRFVNAREDPAGNRWFLSDDVGMDEGKWGINIVNSSESDWLEVNPTTHTAMEVGNVFDCAFDATGVYLGLSGFGVKLWVTGGFEWSDLTSTAEDYWVTILDGQQLPSTDIRDLELGIDGSIWIATSAGLVRYRSGRIDSFTVKTRYDEEGLLSGNVFDLQFDGSDNLWIATEKGLNMINGEGVITGAYTTAALWLEELQSIYTEDVISPIPNHSCRALAFEPAGNFLWIGTDMGLARLDVTPSAEEVMPLSEMVLYPNPVHIGRGDNAMRISRISGTVNVKVYTLEGELVHEAVGVTEGDIAWDLLTMSGYKAGSGIYIVRVSGQSGDEMRKVAIIK